MEQTNLVVSPDGKTWDEVTRDVSYIGVSGGFSLSTEIAHSTSNTTDIQFSLSRGVLMELAQ